MIIIYLMKKSLTKIVFDEFIICTKEKLELKKVTYNLYKSNF